jgi:hypothetical protein
MNTFLLLLLLLAHYTCCTTTQTTTINITSASTPRTFSLVRGVDRGPACTANGSVEQPLASSGTTLIRTHDAGVLDWCVVFPNPTLDPTNPLNYNWTAGDILFHQIVDNGYFSPYLRLGVSWTVPTPSCLHPDPTVFSIVAVTMLERYKGFIEFVEIWNEPDGVRFWNSSAADFWVLFDTTARAVKVYNSSLRVGGPGVASPLAVKSYNYSFGLLDYIAAHKTPIDFFSWHSYGDIANPPSDWGHSPEGIYNTTIVSVRSALAQRNLTHVAQHITEWQPVILGNASVTGSAEAASFTASALTIMASAADVQVSIFYPACEGVGPDGSWGMFLDWGNGTLSFRRETHAWEIVGSLLRDAPLEMLSNVAPPLVTDFTVLAGASVDGTSMQVVVSARSSNSTSILVSAPLNSVNNYVTAQIIMDSVPLSGGLYMNWTNVPVMNGLISITVDALEFPAVILFIFNKS